VAALQTLEKPVGLYLTIIFHGTASNVLFLLEGRYFRNPDRSISIQQIDAVPSSFGDNCMRAAEKIFSLWENTVREPGVTAIEMDRICSIEERQRQSDKTRATGNLRCKPQGVRDKG